MMLTWLLKGDFYLDTLTLILYGTNVHDIYGSN